MIRTLLWIIGGAGLGVLVHLVVILTMPSLSETNIWTKVSDLGHVETLTILDELTAQSPNELHLDPELIYGICKLDLSKGIGVINARLPDSFWSVSVFDAMGRAVYGTTNRSSLNQVLMLGIFNEAQTKLLASQELDISDGLLIVEAKSDELFAVFRLAPPHKAMRLRYKSILSQIKCAHIED